MSKSWMIATQNDPLGALRKVLQALWEITDLEYALAPQNGSLMKSGPVIFDDPVEFRHFNPFTPIMPINAARLVPDLINKGERVAAVLRPCEMRTLDGMANLNQLSTKNLLTISVDCLGTLPVEEFEWRTQRKGSPKGLTEEALQFARQGGIVPYRYRAACQICKSPQATDAKLNIAVLGLPVRQYLLITSQDQELAQSLQGENALAMDIDLLSQHQRVVARLVERGCETRNRIFSGLAGMLPDNIDSLIEPLRGCDDCRICLDSCPICTGDFPRQDNDGQFVDTDVMEWLISCSECGICEQSCPKHLPLTIIFGHIRDQFVEQEQ